MVAADDVAFVYMKASEGGDFKDGAFARNWAGSGAAGLARGAYHFFQSVQAGPVAGGEFPERAAGRAGHAGAHAGSRILGQLRPPPAGRGSAA
ncbi:GH25 family lysozyme [Roseibium salinum]|nr:GH25 family lysozyme [Roseibium salinum]